MRKNNFPFTLLGSSSFLAENLCNKKRLQHIYLLYTYLGDPEKLSNPTKCPSHHFKYLLQLKTKEDGEGLWKSIRKSIIKQEYDCYANLNCLPSPEVGVSKDLVIHLWGQRKTPLQMEISLVNVNLFYKRENSIRFSELLLWALFLKNNQVKPWPSSSVV